MNSTIEQPQKKTVSDIGTNPVFFNIKDKMPPAIRKDWRYSIKVIFKTVDGEKFLGWYRFDFKEWVVNDKMFDRLNVTYWRYLTKKEHAQLRNVKIINQ